MSRLFNRHTASSAVERSLVRFRLGTQGEERRKPGLFFLPAPQSFRSFVGFSVCFGSSLAVMYLYGSNQPRQPLR
jgi:hypothetical protein